MEKQSTFSSSQYIGSTLDNIILNSNINLSKMKEILKILDKSAKSIIIPILKIQKKISKKFDIFTKDYNEIKEKPESTNKEIITHNEESKFDIKNITDVQLTQKYSNNNENLILFYKNITDNIDLFTKLINSKEYEQLIKGFNEILSDKEMFDEEEKEKANIKEKDKSIDINNQKMEIEKISNRENNKIKKAKQSIQKKNSKKSGKKMGVSKKKGKKEVKKLSHKKRKENDLLEMLKNEFPTNSYIQKISKTFLSRRLYKNVIYRHYFYYKENGEIEENRLRSSGESTFYKYCKVIFNFFNDNIINTDKIDEIMGKELKQQFSKIDYENKIYIIGGKISRTLKELIERVFKKDLLKELFVVQATLEFYEFYEELVNEFDENDKNVRIILCEDKLLKHLREDWNNLKIVRNYVKEKKAEKNLRTIKLYINDIN